MNEQEIFWAGEAGDRYTERNNGYDLIVNNKAFFLKALKRAGPIRSVLEYGANIGLNLIALRALYPDANLEAIEINPKAAELIPKCYKVHVGSLLDAPSGDADLVLCKGILIHLAPEDLPHAYDVIHKTSTRLILLAEYFNPTPLEVPYRGEAKRLWKRDFAGEMLDRFSDLELIDYGFSYKRDAFPQDNLHWFLMRKGQ